MQQLGIIYYVPVNSIEDNLAHLCEHCLVRQLQSRMNAAGFLFWDCYAITGKPLITLDITVHNQAAAEQIDDIMDNLQPVTESDIKSEISRIEAEDDLPLYYHNINAVVKAVNALLKKLDFQTVSDYDELPSLDAADKPTDSLLRYSIGARSLSISYHLPRKISEIEEQIIDYLASQFMRQDGVYAVDCHLNGDHKVYQFKYCGKATPSELQKQATSYIDSADRNAIGKCIDEVSGESVDVDKLLDEITVTIK